MSQCNPSWSFVTVQLIENRNTTDKNVKAKIKFKSLESLVGQSDNISVGETTPLQYHVRVPVY